MTKRDNYFRQIIDGFQGTHRALSPRTASISRQLPISQRAVLFAVAIHGELNIRRLADILQITPGATTQHITALESKHLLARVSDPADRRGVLVSLSTEGEAYISQLEHETLLRMKDVFSEVSDDELHTFVAVLGKINAKLRRDHTT